VGYFPVFTWVASLSGLLDTFVFATTGQKSGLSSSPENQIKQVLETVAVSLRDIVPNESEKRRQAEEKENKATLLEKFERYMTGHKRPIQKKVKTDEESEQERKALELSTPVVIIDNYLHRETAKSEVLWKEIAEWASLLIENEVAHVVIVSSNAGVIKPLAKGKGI
jgi:putative cell wall-binding protein